MEENKIYIRENERLISENLKLKKDKKNLISILKKIEFTEDTGKMGDAILKFCPICGAAQGRQKHDSNCILNNTLLQFKETD